MKLTIIAMLILCSAAAFGQAGAGSLSNTPYVLELPDHPQHASYTAMASEQPLVGGGSDNFHYAQGERPLWEFGPVSQPTPLGDVARAYRNQKSTAKKAEITLEKQGS